MVFSWIKGTICWGTRLLTSLLQLSSVTLKRTGKKTTEKEKSNKVMRKLFCHLSQICNVQHSTNRYDQCDTQLGIWSNLIWDWYKNYIAFIFFMVCCILAACFVAQNWIQLYSSELLSQWECRRIVNQFIFLNCYLSNAFMNEPYTSVYNDLKPLMNLWGWLLGFEFELHKNHTRVTRWTVLQWLMKHCL